jgi:hypothetical protein
MRHARPDYERFQDPAGLIPQDEPVFLIRAQDITAAPTVRFWASQAEARGADPRMVKRVRAWADEIERYQDHNGVKVPDMPEPQA